MALLSDYVAGTVSVSAGATAVTGVGTAWQSAGFQEGDEFFAAGWHGIVQSVNSNTSLTLYPMGVRGAALSGAAYRLRYQGDNSRVTAQARQLIELLGGSGNLEAIGGLVGSVDKIIRFTGSGTVALNDFKKKGQDLLAAANTDSAYAALGDIPDQRLPSRIQSAATQVTTSGGLDAISESGWVSVSNANVATVNGPPGASGGIVFTGRYDATNSVQIYSHVTGNNRQWMRFRNGLGWQPWVLISTPILGSVSQSGGVPTGSVIERGSNSNGEYVRFADGTQICYGTAAPNLITLFDAYFYIDGAPPTWVFPAPFVGSIPQVNVNKATGAAALWGVPSGIGLTSCLIGGAASRNRGVTNMYCTAIGRWF